MQFLASLYHHLVAHRNLRIDIFPHYSYRPLYIHCKFCRVCPPKTFRHNIRVSDSANFVTLHLGLIAAVDAEPAARKLLLHSS